jgi:cobalt-zinc-cadmium efflux system outer membrane protein
MAQLAGDTLVLTREAAQILAIEANPELLAATWRPEAARGDVRSADLLQYNPQALFEARTPGDGFASRFEAELGLEVEIGGQRGLRGNATEAALAAALRWLDDDGRLLLAEVGRAYHGLTAAEQRVALVLEMTRYSEQLDQAVRTQLAEGEVSVLQANLAAIEAARARARALESASARTTAALRLERLLGLDPSGAIQTAGPTAPADGGGTEEPMDALVGRALSLRPELRAIEHDVERAREEERLARRASVPNLRVAALVTREAPLVDPRLGVAVGMTLPLFNRNQGLADRRRAEISEVVQLGRAAELRVRTEVEDALRVYRSTEREVRLLEAEMLEPIRENRGLLEIAYREGKMDLTNILLIRNQLLEAELSYWDAWERRERARTDLESATGEILQGVSFGNGSDR